MSRTACRGYEEDVGASDAVPPPRERLHRPVTTQTGSAARRQSNERYRRDPMSILVLFEIETVDGAANKVIDGLRRNLGDTRARRGCESVTVHQDHDRPSTILMIERWASRQDDEAYRAWRAGEGAIAEIAPYIVSRRVRYLDDLDA
jgi:quinol monooxygenase YgiN